VMDKPEWAASLRFSTELARKQNEPELDRLLSEWTRTFPSGELMELLQRAGVHAAKVNYMPDLFSDPQLRHRRFWRPVNHKEVGIHQAEMPAFDLSLTPAADPIPDPCLCEHTAMVLKKLLGLSQDEIDKLEAQGSIELESAVAAAGNH
jgi:crotonobetainyl-CoA:carnitine CoA-transferase CaiB-like acyl-CoA transferase